MLKIISLILLLIVQIILAEPSCSEGVNHCSRCNSVTKLCVKCEKNIYTPDEFGGCTNSKKCISRENYCLECNERGNLCSKCDDGYFPDKNGGCSYSDNCEISYEGKCLKCIEDFILIGENFYFGEGLKICKSLNSEDLKNCDKIDEEKGYCSSCKEGYYLNSGDKKCSKTLNCYQSTFDICQKCNFGYYLNKRDDKCEKETNPFINCKETTNNENCDICRDYYYFDRNKKCILFNYCDEADEGSNCQKCIEGFYLTSNRDSCVPTENCLFGDKELGICLTCEDNFYLDFEDGKCKSNQEENDFKYCLKADNGICKQCFYGYYLSENFLCSSTQNCAESSNGLCLLCSDNYHMGLDNRCSNVAHCIYSNSYNECIECEEGFYYDKNNKTCKIAEDIFKNCKYGNEQYFCEKCKDNYYINRTDNLCYSNEENGIFFKCIETDFEGINCEKCAEDYYLGTNDNKCTRIKGCSISENENKCIECDEYYCLDEKTGKCIYNDEIDTDENKFYYRCNRTNKEGTACEICVEGYELKNGLCIDNKHCIEKNLDGSCSKCQNNEDGIFCLNEIFGCVEIYYNNCLECNEYMDFDSCTKCFEGYSLNKYSLCDKDEED